MTEFVSVCMCVCVTSQRWPPVVQLSLDEQREDAAVEDAMFRLAEAAHLLVSREKLLKTLAYVMLLLCDARDVTALAGVAVRCFVVRLVRLVCRTRVISTVVRSLRNLRKSAEK